LLSTRLSSNLDLYDNLNIQFSFGVFQNRDQLLIKIIGSLIGTDHYRSIGRIGRLSSDHFSGMREAKTWASPSANRFGQSFGLKVHGDLGPFFSASLSEFVSEVDWSFVRVHADYAVAAF